MRPRIVVFVLVGVLIGGAIAAPLINSKCEPCGGEGKLACPVCGGTGAAPHYFVVECKCGGDPDCPICHGGWFHLQMGTKPCQECDGKGGTPCPFCHGDGKRSLLERIPDLWRGKPRVEF